MPVCPPAPKLKPYSHFNRSTGLEWALHYERKGDSPSPPPDAPMTPTFADSTDSTEEGCPWIDVECGMCGGAMQATENAMDVFCAFCEKSIDEMVI